MLRDNDEKHKYDDMLNLPHHVSKTHLQMSMSNRAAQFPPFAALTGHDEKIKESARLMDKRVELDEYEIARLDEKLQRIENISSENPQITIRYFQPDSKKVGGEYLTFTGNVKKIDRFTHQVLFCDGTVINIKQLYDIDIMQDIYRDFGITG